MPWTRKDGRTMTEADAVRLAEEIETGFDPATATRVGRPSLAGGDGASPRVNFRMTDELHRRAVQRAEREGKSLSELARDALAAYVD